jgi:hypothetical protein
MKPEVVQKILGIATYPMVAIDKGRRDEMLRILMTAAAQYVGVALPDLPATQLLRFTDEATREAVAKIQERVRAKEAEAAQAEAARVEAEAEEYETVEVVEEVLVDEEGHIVEASEDYEIIEEVVEIVEEEAVSTEEIEVIEELEAIEEALEKPITATSIEEEAFSTEATSPQEEILEEPVEFKLAITSPEFSSTSTQDSAGIEVEIEEISEPEAAPDEMKIAKDLISEVLDADEIIAAEIDKVSKDELDIALEAFGSDEVILIEGETEETSPVDFQAIKEMEAILGDLEQQIGVPKEVTLIEETSDSTGLETIEELDDMLDDFEREHEKERSEETSESDDSD